MPLKGTRRSRANIVRKRKGSLFMTQAEAKRVNKEKKLAAAARKRAALIKKVEKEGKVKLRTDYTALYRKKKT